ncbi:glycosyltransferase [Peribacillus psychrosaccharolyticus]|uniref:Glycosyltransferase n=1 Tax=Peribacillus psychrosaccharolyticus TaxID=1407 RepID=A0A974NN78_PERPY|nr:glycosyltransferase [Peribacillus psychrosaccharolyticus]MEC2056053.1 glycosyltransferase [Peribacillus psychrosaccharolyticus]QQT00749.1 glycosyltransferase [Peribacillus psychrosaccharolyticus]
MKKNILFVLNNLNCGGAEKALISLLETIDYSMYNVDLYLFKHEGIFFNKIPKRVKLLKEPFEYKYFDMPIKKALIGCIQKGRVDIGLSRIRAGYIFKREKNNAICTQKIWKYVSKSLKSVNKQYDVAIGYLENHPIYFCIDKVIATKKIGFIHNDYDKLGMDPDIDMDYFCKLDNIVTVSEECANILKQRFPMFSHKVEVMYNIVSPNMINNMALEKVAMNFKGVKLVSVGRLTYQKGFEMAVEACKSLVESGHDIQWYIIGEGEDREKLEKMIEEYHLKGIFILLGLKENPYPYINQADIYVQPSRFEGKSIAIDEAKILHKPIIATNFSTAKDQLMDKKNGLIVEMDSTSIFEGIKKIIGDDVLRTTFIDSLAKEKLGTENEIQKLYDFCR